MLKSFDLAKWFHPRAPMGAMRLGVAVLVLANCVAAYFLIRPIGGSPEELREQLSDLRTQLKQKQLVDERVKSMAGKVETGREQGTEFLNTYFLDRRSAYRSVLSELVTAAKDAGILSRESSYTLEPVEGSDSLELMKISANYQGTYADLIHFVNRLDKSERLLIIEGLQANPQQNGQALNIGLKLEAFIRDDAGAGEMRGTQ